MLTKYEIHLGKLQKTQLLLYTLLFSFLSPRMFDLVLA